VTHRLKNFAPQSHLLFHAAVVMDMVQRVLHKLRTLAPLGG
jgi:hypothetical protein